MKASDVMTPTILSVPPDAALMQAVRLMLQHHISGLPVVDAAGKLVGIVTEGDLLRRVEIGTQRKRPRWLEFLIGPGRLATEYAHASGRKVHEVMTREVHTVSDDAPLDEIVQLMERHRIKRLPVMRGGKLVGMVTRANLLRALASVAREVKPASADDRAIREALVKELHKQPWAPIALIDIVVRNGVVQLWGAITDERQREALTIAAENVPGIKAVEDHLVWVEPTSGMVFASPQDAERAEAS
jgi:CBS-domain-containing membrane protein